MSDLSRESENLNDRLLYAQSERCPCGYGMAYDRGSKIFTESGSPFVVRPDQWECAGTLLYRANELPEDELARMLITPHRRPEGFDWSGITPTRVGQGEQTTRGTVEPKGQPNDR